MKYLTITKRQIEEFGIDPNDYDESDYAYKNLLHRFIGQTRNTNEPVKVIDLIGGLNYRNDFLEIAYYKLPEMKLIHLALDCAEKVHHLIEVPIALEIFKASKDLIYHPELQNIRDKFRSSKWGDTDPLIELPRSLNRMIKNLYGYEGTSIGLVDCIATMVTEYSFCHRFDLVAYVDGIISRVFELDPDFDLAPMLIDLFTIEE